jgi:hypothetical protein
MLEVGAPGIHQPTNQPIKPFNVQFTVFYSEIFRLYQNVIRLISYNIINTIITLFDLRFSQRAYEKFYLLCNVV